MHLIVSTVVLGLLGTACSGNVFDLAVGDCFDDGDMSVEGIEEVGEVPMVECSEPHDNEVYAVVTVEGERFPGEVAIQTEADEVCLDAFSGFVGLDYQTSVLDFGWLVPTAETWEVGDRVVACFIYRVDLEKVTGTLHGTGI
ncbi:MAG TPA: septum formation family protein [Acidimicrobiia bacterium]|nr:septum formation family protein [Acidimicrobiia bacterium]